MALGEIVILVTDGTRGPLIRDIFIINSRIIAVN